MIKLGPLAVIVAAALMAASAAAEAQQSYPVICRSGPGMNATLQTGGNLQLNFEAGTEAAQPTPGACVWIDRGFRSGEPTQMQVSGNVDWATYIAQNVLQGGTFYAHIYNNSQGWMIVTRVGP